jgi:hypothetical protein
MAVRRDEECRHGDVGAIRWVSGVSSRDLGRR